MGWLVTAWLKIITVGTLNSDTLNTDSYPNSDVFFWSHENVTITSEERIEILDKTSFHY